jgi:cyclopropane-fatty-acyl-phospholipid synthase
MEPLGIEIAERTAVPDALLRAAIRTRVGRRIRRESRGGVEAQSERLRALIADSDRAAIAIATDAANLQHYEVPAQFFALCLGPRRKYSCALWPDGVDDLGAAEQTMLALYAQRAQLRDGQEILDLGCGWGSLTLWLAERFPASTVTGVSNSASQRAYIEHAAAARGLANVRVLTSDVNAFVPDRSFDRILSVEMLEHVRNHRALLGSIAGWLRPDGRLFVHVFSHRTLAFRFDAHSRSDWIGRHFFTGGSMPSDDLLPRVADRLTLVDAWRVSGTHYARTARAWLENLDANRDAARGVLAAHVGTRAAGRQLRRWRLFFLSCEGLWGYDDGNQFIVSHYLFRRADAAA